MRIPSPAPNFRRRFHEEKQRLRARLDGDPEPIVAASENIGLLAGYKSAWPLTFRRRGGRKQVVAPEGWPGPALAPRPARVDTTLVKALARAHRWQGMLKRRLRLDRGAGQGGEDQPVLLGPGAPAHPARARDRGEHPRRATRPGEDYPRAFDEAVSGGLGRAAIGLLTGRFAPAAGSGRDGPLEQTRPQAAAVAGAGPRPTSAKSHSRKAATLRRFAVASGQTR